MNNQDINDKLKLESILNEINNLKRYNKQLNENTKGEKLENYINVLNKSLLSLEDKIETSLEK